MERLELCLSNTPPIETYAGSDWVDMNLYVLLDGAAFPDAQWTDNAPSILGMWSEALLRAPETGALELPFMDGSYCLKLQKDGDQLTVSAWNLDARAEGIPAVSCTLGEVCRTLLHAWNRLQSLVCTKGSPVRLALQESVANTASHYRALLRQMQTTIHGETRR